MDANAAVNNAAWILAEMIRIAQKNALDLTEAKALVEALTEKRYPNIEDVEGRVYFHFKKKSAPDVALLALAYKFPRRISKDDLIATVERNGFKKANARIAVQRVLKYTDDNGQGQLRVLATGRKLADDLMQSAGR